MERLADRTEQLLRARGEHAEPAGTLCGKALATKAFSHSPTGSDAEAAMWEASRGQWSDARVADFIAKSPTGATTSTDLGGGGVALDFLTISGSALLALPNVVMQPGEGFLVREDTHIGGVELPEGEAVPMGLGTYSRETLTVRRFVSDMEVFTEESLKSLAAATAFATSLARAAGTALDSSFLSTATGGGLDTATAVSSTGTSEAQIRADLRSMLAAAADQGQNLERSVWVMSPRTAGHLSTLLTAGNVPAHPQIGARGGLLLNLPVLVSAGAATEPGESPYAASIALLDPAGVIRSPAAAEFRSSRSATIEMDSAPSHDSTTPTMSTALVSMFQTNSVAMFGVIFAGFYVRPGAAVVMVTAY